MKGWDGATFLRAFPNGKKQVKDYEQKLHEMVTNYLLLAYPAVYFISSLTGESNSNKRVRARNARIQHSSGQPDLLILAKSRGFTGLALELKTLSNSPFKSSGDLRTGAHLKQQDSWLRYLRGQGWSAHFAVGFDNTKKLIDGYLQA